MVEVGQIWQDAEYLTRIVAFEGENVVVEYFSVHFSGANKHGSTPTKVFEDWYLRQTPSVTIVPETAWTLAVLKGRYDG